MAAKKISLFHSATGKTVYCVVRRAADGYLLDDADGSFSAAPADAYLSLAEDAVIKGLYEVEESRAIWTAGKYEIFAYSQVGGSPAPVADSMIGAGELHIQQDAEVSAADAVDAALGGRVLDVAARTMTYTRRDGSPLATFDVTTASIGTPIIARVPQP